MKEVRGVGGEVRPGKDRARKLKAFGIGRYQGAKEEEGEGQEGKVELESQKSTEL